MFLLSGSGPIPDMGGWSADSRRTHRLTGFASWRLRGTCQRGLSRFMLRWTSESKRFSAP